MKSVGASGRGSGDQRNCSGDTAPLRDAIVRAGNGDVAATLDLCALAALAPHADLERLAADEPARPAP